MMTICQDIDYSIAQMGGATERNRSYFMWNILDRCDQVKSAITTGKNHLDDFTCYSFIPPTLRGITKEYLLDKAGLEETIEIIDKTKAEAKTYLESKGFSLGIYLKDQEEQEKNLMGLVERHEQALIQLKNLVNTLKKL